MTQFLGNLITLLGGAGGILIGVAFVAIVIAFLALPLLFIARPSELGPPESNRERSSVRVQPVL